MEAIYCGCHPFVPSTLHYPELIPESLHSPLLHAPVLYEDEVPVSADAKKLARKTGFSALHHALHDGEDYELLFTLSGKESKKLLASSSFPVRLSKIGHIKGSNGISMQGSNGKLKKIKPVGYKHFK